MRAVLLFLLILGIYTVWGCTWFEGSKEFITVFSLLEVVDAGSNKPVEGAEVKVSGVVVAMYGTVTDIPVRVAPTDQLGYTFVPVVSLVELASQVVLHVTMESGTVSETLDVDWRDGASVMGHNFAVRVVQTQSSVPPPPVLRVVDGSNPPLIEVNGYIRDIGVYSHASDQVIWEIVSYANKAYVETVSVGEIPEDFEDGMQSYPNGVIPHPIAPNQPLSSESYTVYASLPFSNDYVFSDPYCLSDTGTVIPCSN